jgi:signal transduction histidine kinase
VLRDPGLTLCYVMDDGNLIDALGNVVEQGSPPPGGVTVVDFDGQEIARLDHSTAVQVERRPLEDIAAIAGPAIAQEREAAVLAARLTKLAAARRAVIERGDVERRALERELHDHTQQRLVSIMIELRMAAERDPEPFDVENALVDVGSALEQVRTIAHGVFPTGLAEEGLAAVLEELALRTHGRIDVDASRGRATDPVAEATAYMVVAECVGRLPDRDASVQVVVAPQRVDIRVMGEGANDAALAGVRARTLALGGSWRRADDDVLQVVVPCAS